MNCKKKMVILLANQTKSNTTSNNKTKIQSVILFYGKQGVQLLSKMKKQLKKKIPLTMKVCIIYAEIKLSTQFPVKDRTKVEHRYNVM